MCNVSIIIQNGFRLSPNRRIISEPINRLLNLSANGNMEIKFKLIKMNIRVIIIYFSLLVINSKDLPINDEQPVHSARSATDSSMCCYFKYPEYTLQKC